MAHDYLAMPEDFGDPMFAQNNKALFDEFIDMLIQGHPERQAFGLVFGVEFLADEYSNQRVLAAQRNPYFKQFFKKRLTAIKMSDLWSTRDAVHALLKVVRDPFAKDSSKIVAVKELNVIYGITVIDEFGNTKMGRSMDDFYGKFAEGAGQPPAAETPAQKH